MTDKTDKTTTERHNDDVLGLGFWLEKNPACFKGWQYNNGASAQAAGQYAIGFWQAALKLKEERDQLQAQVKRLETERDKALSVAHRLWWHVTDENELWPDEEEGIAKYMSQWEPQNKGDKLFDTAPAGEE